MSASRPSLIVVQSRLASTRLPAKALLPLGGRPTVVLCAQRAANNGLPVVVATSDLPGDDAIAAELQRAGISCFRGAHADVLQRVAAATRGLPERAAIVRLTADNVFPDGEFVHALLAEFEQRDVAYLSTGSPADGLPYGMSAEVFSAATLRAAERAATTAADREHVTPWIRRQASVAAHVQADTRPHWPRLRCTLDSCDDYVRLRQVFAGVEDPVGIAWRALVERLAALGPFADAPRIPYRIGADGRVHSVLTLGTAQLGAPYGIANETGMPADAEAAALLRDAADAGITALDTARAYGRAEERIGRLLSTGLDDRLEVVTKLDVIDLQLAPDAPASQVRSAVDASVFASTHALRCDRIGTLLLHRWSHRHAFGAAAWQRVVELRRDGVVERLGASVSDVPEAIAALDDANVEHLQCPVNLLDHRWRADEFLTAVRARPDVVVHARSVLLQGLLTLPALAPQWKRVAGVDADAFCAKLDAWSAELDRLDRVDLCLAYVRGLAWVTSLVVGMETVAQLHRNLAYARRPALTPEQMRRIEADMPMLQQTVLDPAQWDKANG